MRACPLGKASGSAHETERGRVAYPLGKASGSAHPIGAERSGQNIYFKITFLEGSPSGLWRALGKRVGCQSPRGFKSLSFRIFLSLNLSKII